MDRGRACVRPNGTRSIGDEMAAPSLDCVTQASTLGSERGQPPRDAVVACASFVASRVPMVYRTADERIAEELSRHALRATRQRVAALRLLRRLTSHPTAAELHDRLVSDHENLSQKTVYEILDALVKAGLAARVTSIGEPYRYEARAEPHYHATCRVCGRLNDIPASADSQIRGRAALPEGFRVEKIDVTIRGVCLRCRDEV